jgi:hypothetical protein
MDRLDPLSGVAGSRNGVPSGRWLWTTSAAASADVPCWSGNGPRARAGWRSSVRSAVSFGSNACSGSAHFKKAREPVQYRRLAWRLEESRDRARPPEIPFEGWERVAGSESRVPEADPPS